MNAALGAARAASAAGDHNAAINYANTAATLANTSASATVATNLRQQIYQTAGPGHGPGATMGTSTTWQGETTDYAPTIQNKSGGGGFAPSPSPTPPRIAPPPPPPPPPAATTFAVKQPAPSLVQYDADTLPQDLITDLLYEDVGGQELINIARHDTIDGQDVAYSLIKNLSVLNQSFNPNNILAGQISYSSQLGQYSLDISSKLPFPNTLYPTGPAYLDNDGNLVIELLTIGPDEYIEVEISSNGTIY